MVQTGLYAKVGLDSSSTEQLASWWWPAQSNNHFINLNEEFKEVDLFTMKFFTSTQKRTKNARHLFVNFVHSWNWDIFFVSYNWPKHRPWQQVCPRKRWSLLYDGAAWTTRRGRKDQMALWNPRYRLPITDPGANLTQVLTCWSCNAFRNFWLAFCRRLRRLEGWSMHQPCCIWCW